jgi:hypothetical protein
MRGKTVAPAIVNSQYCQQGGMTSIALLFPYIQNYYKILELAETSNLDD